MTASFNILQFWLIFVHAKFNLSSLRSQCWMRHFLWFSNTVLWHSRRCYSILRHFIMIKLLLSVLANIDEGTQVRSWAPFIFKAFPWRIFNVSIMMHRQRAPMLVNDWERDSLIVWKVTFLALKMVLGSALNRISVVEKRHLVFLAIFLKIGLGQTLYLFLSWLF